MNAWPGGGAGFLFLTLAVLSCAPSEQPPAQEKVAHEEADAGAGPLARLIDLEGRETGYAETADGRRFAVAVVGQEGSEILVGAVGEEPRRLVRGGEPAWPPDGARLSFSADGAVWVIPSTGGEPTRLSPRETEASSPHWSPDGRRVVYSGSGEGSRDLWIQDTDGGDRRRLTRHPDDEWRPRWSPDGEQIVFYTTWDGAMTEIWAVAASGGEPRRLTSHPAEDYSPVWSPDGEHVAFSSRRDGPWTDIWQVSPEGGEATRLTRDAGISQVLTWTSQGVVVYAGERDTHLYSISLAGDLRPLTQGREAYLDPEYSRDGRLLALVRGWTPEITTFVLGEGEPLALGDGAALHKRATWSPDGETVAAILSDGGWIDTNDLWVLGLDGKRIRRLTSSGYVDAVIWCGESMIFGAKSEDRQNARLWSLPAAGGVPRMLLDDASHNVPSSCIPGSEDFAFTAHGLEGPRVRRMPVAGGEAEAVALPREAAEAARWSFDGSRVAFVSPLEDGTDGLFILELATGELTRLEHGGRAISRPSWDPAGDRVVVVVDRSDFGVFRYAP